MDGRWRRGFRQAFGILRRGVTVVNAAADRGQVQTTSAGRAVAAGAVRPRQGVGEPRRVEQLVERLGDARGGRVVLVSHCLLNENTRYLGGAGRAECVREVMDACAGAGLGMVQMPCPEQQVWGGVLKRHLLRAYGSPAVRSARVRKALLPVALAYTRWRYRLLARAVATQSADCRRSGVDVVAVLGVDGSPSCGVQQSLDPARALEGLAHVDPRTVTSSDINAIVRDSACTGAGMYSRALQRQLRKRGMAVPFLAHDLFAELEGRPSPAVPAIELLARTAGSRTRADGHPHGS